MQDDGVTMEAEALLLERLRGLLAKTPAGAYCGPPLTRKDLVMLVAVLERRAEPVAKE